MVIKIVTIYFPPAQLYKFKNLSPLFVNKDKRFFCSRWVKALLWHLKLFNLCFISSMWLNEFPEGKGHLMLAVTASMVKQFIRSLDHKAIPSENDAGPNIALAIYAGLGKLARNRFLIAEWFGRQIRISKVLAAPTVLPAIIVLLYSSTKAKASLRHALTH
jgi:hypothetical protein